MVLTVPCANAEILIWTHSANTLHDSRTAVDRGIGEGGVDYRTRGRKGADDGLQHSWVNLTPGWVLPIPSFRLHAHFLAWTEKKGSGWEESPLPACWSTARRTRRQTSWKRWGWSIVFHRSYGREIKMLPFLRRLFFTEASSFKGGIFSSSII